MKRLISIALASVIISGCANPLKVKGEIQEVKVPLLYCPAPATFNLKRPILAIHQLSDQDLRSEGKVSQAYAADILQLIGYTKQLEQVLEYYDDANVAYEELEQRLRNSAPPKPVTGDEQ